MKNYFNLLLVLTNRKIKKAGLNPGLGYLLGLAAFILLAEYLFQKTSFLALVFNSNFLKKIERTSYSQLLEIKQKIKSGYWKI
jgi:type IV secretory pathway TrbL component